MFENITNRNIVPDQNIADLAQAVIKNAIKSIKRTTSIEKLEDIVNWTYDQKNIWWACIEEFLEYDRGQWQKNIRRLAEDKIYELQQAI